jgi:hypothetical protein
MGGRRRGQGCPAPQSQDAGSQQAGNLAETVVVCKHVDIFDVLSHENLVYDQPCCVVSPRLDKSA